MPDNLARKLIASHLAEPSAMKPGDEIQVRFDHTLTHDITAVMGYLAFQNLGLPRVRTEKSVSYLDHNLLYIDSRTPDDHVYLQSVAKKYGLYLSRPGNGICHSIHYARLGIPGKSLIGSDSHTTTGGAIGMLAVGAGGMEVAMAMAGLPIRLKMPQVIRVTLTGRLRPGRNAKDVVLEMLRRESVKGGVGKIYEYVGDGVKTLSIPERGTIANMGAEMGATTSVFPADEVTRAFFCAQGREKDFVPQTPDEGCLYDGEITIDLSTLEPLVARPSQPDNVCAVSEAEKVRVNQVYIGSCTNASYSDVKKAAAVLKGKHVDPNVSLTVAVSTRQIFRMLMEEGVITDLVDAGARITELCCGACCGIGQAPTTNGVSVRTSNRNFPGRSGTPDAHIYLVSPETAAACAITGTLSTADVVMEDVSVLGSISEPDTYFIDDSMLIPPIEDTKDVEIIMGPYIKPLPINVPPAETIRAHVSLKAGDNISTDDITPAGAELSSMRSNIPMIAEYAFHRYDPDFVSRAKEMKVSVIIGGENYGQGSSREHAAITPMFLGVKAIVAKSMARIHKNNLINHGVIPMIFDDPAAYDQFSLGDEVEIENCPAQLTAKRVNVRNVTKGVSVPVHLELTDKEVAIILAGGLLPYTKKYVLGDAKR